MICWFIWATTLFCLIICRITNMQIDSNFNKTQNAQRLVTAWAIPFKGRFTLSNFFVQLFFSPFFKTTIGCVNANFWQVSDIFYVLDENRTCSISIRLDQKSRQFLIFSRSDSAKYFYKLAATAGPSYGEMGLNSQNKNCRVSLEYITK